MNATRRTAISKLLPPPVTEGLTRAGRKTRTESPLLAADEMKAGHYEIIFFVGDYFAVRGTILPKIRFLDQVPVHVGIADAGASYHVPLLCSPWAYSTYRGS